MGQAAAKNKANLPAGPAAPSASPTERRALPCKTKPIWWATLAPAPNRIEGRLCCAARTLSDKGRGRRAGVNIFWDKGLERSVATISSLAQNRGSEAGWEIFGFPVAKPAGTAL